MLVQMCPMPARWQQAVSASYPADDACRGDGRDRRGGIVVCVLLPHDHGRAGDQNEPDGSKDSGTR